MPSKKNTSSAPLTFELPKSLIAKISTEKKKLRLKSASEFVREAIDNFDLEDFSVSSEPQRQISVRLPVSMKIKLVRAAKKKKVSVGELLRVAIDSYEAKAGKKTARR